MNARRLLALGWTIVLHGFALWGLIDAIGRLGGGEWPL
jgi:hypothetical protein